MTIDDLRKKCNDFYVKGLGGWIKSNIVLSSTLSEYLDVPHERILEIADHYEDIRLDGIAITGDGKMVNRIMMERHLLSLHHTGPKWAAIHYGITDKSLLNLLLAFKKKGGKIGSLSDVLLQQHSEDKTLDESLLEKVIEGLYQFGETTIFTSESDKLAHMSDLAQNELGIALEAAVESNKLWLLDKNSKAEIDSFTAGTFCVFTGLPISHFRAEYLATQRPSPLLPDYISWLAIAENNSLTQWIVQHDMKDFSSFLRAANG